MKKRKQVISDIPMLPPVSIDGSESIQQLNRKKEVLNTVLVKLIREINCIPIDAPKESFEKELVQPSNPINKLK